LNHNVTDLELINDLKNEDFFIDLPIKYDIGDNIILVLNPVALKKNFIYKTDEDYFANYKYSLPLKQVFLLDHKKFVNQVSFYTCYEQTMSIIETLKSLFTHDISDNSDDEFIGLLIKENRSLVFPLEFNLSFLKSIELDRNLVNEFIEGIFKSGESEKRSLFINELVSFLEHVENGEKFIFLLKNLKNYLTRATQSYEYYLRDFSYNKLKVEIDGKILDYSQKLQSVINDSQNKLVAIPAGFVLVLTALDFKEILNTKNIVTIFGLCIFILFLKIFIENQKSSLRFITSNLNAYKKTFSTKKDLELASAFEPIEKECISQQKRLFFVEVLLWLVPVISFSIITSIKIDNHWPYIFIILYLLISIIIYCAEFYFDVKKKG
jgi:hypothetical protein